MKKTYYMQTVVAPTEVRVMSASELIKFLGLNNWSFYQLRVAGIIPAPELGCGIRKKYTAEQVRVAVKAVAVASGASK